MWIVIEKYYSNEWNLTLDTFIFENECDASKKKNELEKTYKKMPDNDKPHWSREIKKINGKQYRITHDRNYEDICIHNLK